MSGVEAAGLALAIFPLLISALEHYREGAEVLSDWWKFRRKYTKCKRDIEYHHLTFTANLEELLLPLIADEDELEILLAEPGSSKWSQPALENRLKERLPNSYEPYLDAIHEINCIMSGLTKELGLDNDHIQASIGGGAFKSSRERFIYQGQRIKFAFGNSTREKLFDEFTKYNTRLRDLLQTGDRIMSIKRASKKASTLTNVWKQTRKLYDVLMAAWGCTCQEAHHASLLLCHRTTNVDISFSLLLSYASSDMKESNPESRWPLHEATLKPLEKPVEVNEKHLDILNTPRVQKQKSPNLSRTSLLSRSKTSSMVLTNSSSSLLTSTSSRSSSTTIVGVTWRDSEITLAEKDTDEKLMKNDQKHAKTIENLCGDLAQGSTSEGILKDEHSDKVYQICLTKSPDNQELIQLSDILSKSSAVSFPRRVRYRLALIIASSHVQLHSTIWLGQEWRKNEIVFTKNKLGGEINFDRPHISRDFNASHHIQLQDHTIATLGITILELCFGTCLGDHPIRQKLPLLEGSQNYYLDLAAALEWSTEVNDEAGPAYAGAVAWCLSQHAGLLSKEEQLRKDLFENVVEPLQECYKHLS